MKHFLQDRTLVIAVVISVLLHGLLLAVRFAAPEPVRFKPVDPGLEVILVNAKHDKKPVKAEALAQANLDGGGNADAGRAKSPLPNLKKSEDGDNIKAARRRVAELEQQQKVLAQNAKKTRTTAPKTTPQESPNPAPPTPAAPDDNENSRALARAEAEINRQIEDYNKRPRKTQITPSTREVGYAMYYSQLQKRIENIGTLNFPQQNGKKLYGELVIYIPVFQDGTIYDKEGGPRVERPSGNPALDEAALRIVRRAAPFGRFPENMRTTGKDDVWEIITRFKFTRDDAVQTELRGGSN
ncbi:TonB C-terminal domain-containing protein [Noviherbaspirillum suwonense]|uniref:Protein TonB n=1 Tax=Noviherbaspirillum suwonense TaxID=1224511 RepID=A0ABY1PPS1_9BURK|nr:TonB C-terminal domain-containing protein [Noviherbaspirillum suwonense]SMP41236.1 protein TonB [Noviherbaspirillum suwonense]